MGSRGGAPENRDGVPEKRDGAVANFTSEESDGMTESRIQALIERFKK